MKKPLKPTLCIALVLSSMLVTGCESNTGVVEPPVPSDAEAAAIEARQAEYSKSMAESYGKRK